METQKPAVNGQMQEQGVEDLAKIKTFHDEAFLYISQGLDYEEQNKVSFAVEMYNRGRKRLEEALAVRCDRQYCRGPKWESARKMQQKMRISLQETKERLNIIDAQHTHPEYPMSPIALERPPSYEEACSGTEEIAPIHAKNGLKLEIANEVPRGMSTQNSMIVEEIFTIPDGVQMFYVNADGNVSASESPTSLHIYKFKDIQTPTTPSVQRPPAWLQVGEWTFPLLPGQSPALQSGYGAYFFPDLTSATPGSSVGIILPGNSDIDIREHFENFMVELTLLEQEEPVLPDGVEFVGGHAAYGGPKSASMQMRTSGKISNMVIAGAEIVSTCLVKGAEATGHLVHAGASKIREHWAPEHKPLTVDPRLQRSLSNLRSASGTARKVSGFVVCKLGELTMTLGRQMAPHLKTQGSKILVSTGLVSKDTVDTKNPASPINDVMTVAAGGLQGFATVYMGLEQAARTLAYSLANETVKTAQHKYGPEVGGAVDNAVFALGNVALTTHNVSSLGVKAIAKRTAKDTGKAILIDYCNTKDTKEKMEKEKHNTP